VAGGRAAHTCKVSELVRAKIRREER